VNVVVAVGIEETVRTTAGEMDIDFTCDWICRCCDLSVYQQYYLTV